MLWLSRHSFFTMNYLLMQRREIFEQEAMNEDIATSNFMQQNTRRSIIQKAKQIQWNASSTPENETEDAILQKCQPTK